MEFFSIILVIVLSYLAGSIPSAIIVSKKFFGFDIREKGSGNMGSTNAFRVLGWKWGLVVQIADLAKGAFAVLVIAALLGEGITFPSITSFEDGTIIRIIAGISAVSGHIWSIFAGFKGGKGINTAAGFLLSLAPIDVGIAVTFFIIAVIFSGYVSLGSITGAIAFPSSLFVRHNLLNDYIQSYDVMIYFSLTLAILLIYVHRSNIKRLISGTENRFAKLQIFKRSGK